MYENPAEPPLTQKQFALRLAAHGMVAIAILGAGLLLGAIGYHYAARLSWLDSILNASMILTGMGPVSQLNTASAKIFATAYALFSGIMFVAITGLLLTPIFHRLLHKFHFDDSAE